MREDLLDALRNAADDVSVRCVLITGAGGVFSAGADIEELVGLHERGDSAEIARRVDLGAAVVRVIRSMPKPVVAAIDGAAAGAGACLALSCDIRLGSEEATFVQSFARIGLIPDWGGMFSLVRLVGAGRAADLMMTGERLRSREAHAIGLLQRVYPTGTFDDDARAYARRLAAAPPHALALIKRGVRLSEPEPLEEVLTFERQAQPQLFSEPDCLEGLRAFMEKRPPTFKGST